MGASGVLRLDHHGYFSKSKGKIGHIFDMSEGGRMSAVTVDGPELYFFLEIYDASRGEFMPPRLAAQRCPYLHCAAWT